MVRNTALISDVDANDADRDGHLETVSVRATCSSRSRRVGARAAELAPHTARLYAGDWQRFTAFCVASGAHALPAAADTACAFLATPLLGRTVRRRALTAIDHRHRQLGFPAPGDDPAVRAALHAAGPTKPRRRRPPIPSVSALNAAALRCPRDLAGLRDRAVLLLLALGLPRRDLVEIQAERIRWQPGTVELDTALAVPRAARHDLCPARALEDWLGAAAIRYGPAFRKVTRWGTAEPRALGADAVRRILLRRLV